jgi:hypothetical protein
MIEVLVNHLELATDSKSVIASCIRLTVSSSYSFWSSGVGAISKLLVEGKGRSLTFADGDEEDQGGNRVENVQPFTSLGSLTTDIEELVSQLADLEVGLAGASSASGMCESKGELT